MTREDITGDNEKLAEIIILHDLKVMGIGMGGENWVKGVHVLITDGNSVDFFSNHGMGKNLTTYRGQCLISEVAGKIKKIHDFYELCQECIPAILKKPLNFTH